MKPSQIFESLIKENKLLLDSKQRELVFFLDGIQKQIDKRSKSWFKNPRIKGLYLHGKVGRGKTQIMDIFFESIQSKKKERLHFHRFMQKLHNDLSRFSNVSDPIGKAVDEISKNCEVLCFDEFLVEDIGDAMILGRFLEKLFEKKIVLITTSNTKPDELYKDGLHRARFMPVIDLIKRNCHVYKLNSLQDYRLRSLEKKEIYLQSNSKDSTEALKSYFYELAQGNISEKTYISILGRDINVEMLSEGTAWFGFYDICGGPRSSKDYIELTKEFHTLIISDIPNLENKDDEARRFIALIDECYERNVNLIISSEKLIAEIYKGSKLEDPFKRTLSRLEEMRSRDYLAKPHLP